MAASSLSIGDFKLHWLNGGHFRLDGGAMFGAVPKVLWEKKYPAAPDNTIPICNDVLLLQTPERNILIDTGLGNKLSRKLHSIFQISSPWSLITELDALGLSRNDIDAVLLTHCDFDHAGGVVMLGNDMQPQLSFPNAEHYVQKKEWEDVEHPCRRAQSTYWPENFDLLKQDGKLTILDGDREIHPGITLHYTGGHTRGHQLVEICSQDQTAVHLGDIFPTHAHINPLWIMAYDNFPMEVIPLKEKYFTEYQKRDSWFTFYHDHDIKACKLNEDLKICQSV